MSRLHIALCCAGVATIAAAGTAFAATEQWRTATVDLPDGSVAEIQYLGDVPPRVTISVPVDDYARAAEEAEYDEMEYGEFEYGEVDHEELDYDDLAVSPPPATRARRVVQPREAPAVPYAAPPRFVVAGDAPYGSTYEYTLTTTDADGKVCTQRTEWLARGEGEEPEVRQVDEGEGCADVSGGNAPTPAPSIPRPRIVPVDPDAI